MFSFSFIPFPDSLRQLGTRYQTNSVSGKRFSFRTAPCRRAEEAIYKGGCHQLGILCRFSFGKIRILCTMQPCDWLTDCSYKWYSLCQTMKQNCDDKNSRQIFLFPRPPVRTSLWQADDKFPEDNCTNTHILTILTAWAGKYIDLQTSEVVFAGGRVFFLIEGLHIPATFSTGPRLFFRHFFKHDETPPPPPGGGLAEMKPSLDGGRSKKLKPVLKTF